MSQRDHTTALDESIDILMKDEDAHGLVDVAAAVAVHGWHTTSLCDALHELVTALERKATQEGDRLASTLDGLLGDAVSTGARLGYALALTTAAGARGRSAWLAAVESGLAGAGCSLEAHNARSLSVVRGLLDELRSTLSRETAPVLQTAQRPRHAVKTGPPNQTS
jgi:hypothetical protein